MNERKLGPASLARLISGWRSPAAQSPAYRELFEAIRLLVLDGRLGIGIRLPGERDFADVLGVSRTTVAAAYARLRDEGFLVSRHGSGSVVRLPQHSRPDLNQYPGDSGGAELIEMSIASLPASEQVHHAYSHALKQLPRYLPTSGYEVYGLEELRTTIAAYYRARGLETRPEQIFVTQGAQQGLALALRALAVPGDSIVVDHPTYPLALEAIRHASCTVVPVQLPPTGWDLDALTAALRQTRPRMAYLLPDFHNPTGRCMAEDMRRHVADLAERFGTTIVVDETMVDLWLDRPPPLPLAVFDRGGLVVTLGSTGKSFWGGLRVGWMRANEQVVAALARARASVDLGSPILEQLAAAYLLSCGGEAIAARRTILKQRRERLMRSVSELLPDWKVTLPEGGLSAWAELPTPTSTLLASAAAAEGVRIAPGTRFGEHGAYDRFVRLPFALDEHRLEDAVVRIASAWRKIQSSPAHERHESIAGREDII